MRGRVSHAVRREVQGSIGKQRSLQAGTRVAFTAHRAVDAGCSVAYTCGMSDQLRSTSKTDLRSMSMYTSCGCMNAIQNLSDTTEHYRT